MVRLPPKDGRHSSGQAWFTEDPRSQQQEIFSVSPRFAFRYSCYTRFEACVAVPEGPDDMHAFQIIHQECLGGSSRCNRCARGECRYGVRSVARCVRAKNQAFHSSLTWYFAVPTDPHRGAVCGFDLFRKRFTGKTYIATGTWWVAILGHQKSKASTSYQVHTTAVRLAGRGDSTRMKPVSHGSIGRWRVGSGRVRRF